MIDKVGIKIDPKHTVFIQIGDTLPDTTYSPYCKEVLQGQKTTIIAPKRYTKYAYLSPLVFQRKRSVYHAENEQKAKTGIGVFPQ